MDNNYSIKSISFADLKHFNICNSNQYAFKGAFYELKSKILREHGTFDWIDKQIIEKKCFSCTDGIHTKINGEKETCFCCGGSGVYSTKTYKLERWIFKGTVFHIPVGLWDMDRVTYPKNEIKGIITHDNLPGNPVLSYGILLYRFDRDNFLPFINDYSKTLAGKIKTRWIKQMSTSNKIIDKWKLHFGYAENDDELPF